MPSLKLRYMVEDYLELTRTRLSETPLLKLKYLVPDYQELKTYNPDQLSLSPIPVRKSKDTVVR